MKVGVKKKASGNSPRKQPNYGKKNAVFWHVTPCSLVDEL